MCCWSPISSFSKYDFLNPVFGDHFNLVSLFLGLFSQGSKLFFILLFFFTFDGYYISKYEREKENS